MGQIYRHSDGSIRDYPETKHQLDPKLVDKMLFGETRRSEHTPGYELTIDQERRVGTYEDEETDRKVYERDNNKKGTKFDDQKPPIDLIPYDALVEIAKVLQFGEKKYSTANWANGIEIRRLLSAALRHIGQFNNGEDKDIESDTLHIANAATNLIFAIWMMKNRPDMDNRWIKGIKK